MEAFDTNYWTIVARYENLKSSEFTYFEINHALMSIKLI